MFRKVLTFMAVGIFMSFNAFGAAIDFAVDAGRVNVRDVAQSYATSNTVSFNSVRGALVITFNTVVNKILLVNESSASGIKVEFDGTRLGWQGDGTYRMANNNDFLIDAGSSVSVNISTDKISVTPNTSRDSGNFRYLATSDKRVSND